METTSDEEKGLIQEGPIDIADVRTKWFPTDILLKSYYIIVMPNRLMVYGGCNVHYTMFKFGENAKGKVELKNVNWKSSSNGCGDEDDKITERIANVKYLQPVYYETHRNIVFLDEEGN